MTAKAESSTSTSARQQMQHVQRLPNPATAQCLNKAMHANQHGSHTHKLLRPRGLKHNALAIACSLLVKLVEPASWGPYLCTPPCKPHSMSSAGTGRASKSLRNLARAFCDRAASELLSCCAALRPMLLPVLLPVPLALWLPKLMEMLCAAMWACISASALLSAAAILPGLPSPASIACAPLLLPLGEAAEMISASEDPAASIAACFAESAGFKLPLLEGLTVPGLARRPCWRASSAVLMKNAPSVSALRIH